MKMTFRAALLGGLIILLGAAVAPTVMARKDLIYDPGPLKATDSLLKVRVGEQAPDFTLKSLSGKTVSLSDYRGKTQWSSLSFRQHGPLPAQISGPGTISLRTCSESTTP